MQNIPVFTTENGAATLILKEIPYYQSAYIRVLDTQSPKELLDECVSFCRVVGAERIYATGHTYLEAFPFHTEIWEMTALRESFPDTEAALFPVTEETLEKWRSIYNEKMAPVPNASFMTTFDGQKMRKEGSGYFIHKDGRLLGIGMASGDRIDAVISVERGAGFDCMLALNHALSGETVCLQVASANLPAIGLYERLGFIKTSVISRWYQVV